jgi:hypothetical protein
MVEIVECGPFPKDLRGLGSGFAQAYDFAGSDPMKKRIREASITPGV